MIQKPQPLNNFLALSVVGSCIFSSSILSVLASSRFVLSHFILFLIFIFPVVTYFHSESFISWQQIVAGLSPWLPSVRRVPKHLVGRTLMNPYSHVSLPVPPTVPRQSLPRPQSLRSFVIDRPHRHTQLQCSPTMTTVFLGWQPFVRRKSAGRCPSRGTSSFCRASLAIGRPFCRCVCTFASLFACTARYIPGRALDHRYCVTSASRQPLGAW